ncbi:Sugar/inositol transporter [Neofusicoccum parvum]|uniref:Sugar/inositol transporter n=1 Tax=Neofusicoccum parvum TaxID=310453 RepID=A0ACB5SG61_9PEZI|nr:Sugar/inositol transporter [Neofusicoccum parvum]
MGLGSNDAGVDPRPPAPSPSPSPGSDGDRRSRHADLAAAPAPPPHPRALPEPAKSLPAKRRLSAADAASPNDGSKRPRTTARGPNTYPRKRALVACHTCRAKKTKCDNQRPSCGSCLSLACSCSYADASVDHSSFDTASLAILDRLNYAVSLLEAQSSQPTPQPAVVPQSPVDESAHEVELLEQSVAAATSAAHLLDWPIFEHKHGREALDAAVLSHSAGIPADYPGAGTDLDEPAEMSDIQSAQRSSKPGRGIHEEDVPALVQAFLENVHIKNPVLDSTDLKRWARAVREHGFGWSSRSCLLLVACALGALSSPFKPTLFLTSVSSTTSDSIQEAKDYTTAERYYNASRKRIGLLGNSLIAAQCMFLSGVYEMYSLRPLQAWTSFSRAGDIIQIYRMVKPDPTTPKFPSVISLEHRLYWSCLKSISSKPKSTNGFSTYLSH